MWKKIIQSDRLLWCLYGLVPVFVAVQRLGLGRLSNGYTAYENYLIFKNAFVHLWQGLNPYQAFPAEQWDLYKYSPAFALFMAPFALLPDALGLPLWNLLNALPLLGAILALPLEPGKRRFIAWFILLELVTSIQNSQSNGLTAALMLWTWVALERSRQAWAGTWIAAGAFLKIFGAFAALPAVFYPKWRRTALWTLVGTAVLALLPALITGPSQLLQIYRWWWELLLSDHQASIGLSVSGWLESWFDWTPPKSAVTAAGLLLLLGSFFAVWRSHDRSLRLLAHVWASLLLWVVIFNHKAESPTFVIAITGVALWYASLPRALAWHRIALGIAFLFVTLSATDLFPRFLLNEWVKPYVLKAVPCIAIWALITIDLFRTPKAIAADDV